MITEFEMIKRFFGTIMKLKRIPKFNDLRDEFTSRANDNASNPESLMLSHIELNQKRLKQL